MTVPNITLQNYEQAERLLAHEEARIGLSVHAIVTVLVSALLILINVTVSTSPSPTSSPGPRSPWVA